MKLLIWCPRYIAGGGPRLLPNLVNALARQEEVEHIRVVLHPNVDIKNINPGGDLPIEIIPVQMNQPDPVKRPWLMKEGKIWGIKGTGYMKRVLRAILNIDMAKWEAEHQKTIAPDDFQEQLYHHSRDRDVVYHFWPHFQHKHLLVDRPTVCTIQDTIVLDFPEIGGGQFTRAEWQNTKEWVEKTTKVVVSSQHTKSRLVRHFGAAGEGAVVVPHRVSPIPANANSTSDVLGQLPREYIVYPANISTHKNHYNLFVAFSRFQRRKKFPLVLFGYSMEVLNAQYPDWPDLWHFARLTGLIDRLGLRKYEDFYAFGYLSDIDANAIIKNANALIMPSMAEGGGSYPVEEALRCGIPVLCSDIPVMREHLAFTKAKIAWFDPYSPDSIVKSLDEFYDHYEDYKSSVQQHMHAPGQTWDDVARGYMDVFRLAVHTFGKKQVNDGRRHRSEINSCDGISH